jgi:hypothetical protein
VQNVGTSEAFFINLPTRPYDYADPDKYRIPVDSGKIPYSFDSGKTIAPRCSSAPDAGAALRFAG